MISGNPSPFMSAMRTPLSAPFETNVTGGFQSDVELVAHPFPVFMYAAKWFPPPSLYAWMISGRPSPFTSAKRTPVSAVLLARKVVGGFQAEFKVHPLPLLMYAA